MSYLEDTREGTVYGEVINIERCSRVLFFDFFQIRRRRGGYQRVGKCSENSCEKVNGK